MTTDNFSDALAELTRRFSAQLPERLHDIRVRLEQLSPSAWNSEAATEAHRMAHSLAGSAGTYGMQQVGDAARRLELGLAPFSGQGAVPDEAAWVDVLAALAGLEQLAGHILNSDAPNLMQPSLAGDEKNSGALIYLVEDDLEQAQHLAQELGMQGYRVSVFASPEEFRASWGSGEPPAAVVMDMIFSDGKEAGAQVIAEFRENCGSRAPVVFTSVRDDLEAHLAAYRAGGTRYLSKPVDVRRLSRLLFELITHIPKPPYRVLLVDDSPSLLKFHGAVLRQAGMEVRELGEPLQTLEVVREFKPDVTVLDVYMPDATGPELAAALRERDEYAYMPILFLSSEKDMGKQLLALELGGDDFLVKPIAPDHLVSAVSVRARRSRQSSETHRQLKRVLYEREREHLALDEHAIVSIADVAGRIIYVNDKFCEISGYSREELLGQNHRIVKSGEHPQEYYAEMWRTISAGKIWHGQVCNRRRDGSTYWVESTITPFLNANGRPYQYVSIRTDITELKLAELRWELAVEGAGDGVWDWNITTGDMPLSGNYEGMLGYARGELEPTIEAWVKGVHPDDLMRAQTNLEAYLAGKAPSYTIELRLRCKDGGYKWILCRGTVVARDGHGKPIRMIGIHTDIEQRKQNEERLALFARLSDAAKEGIGVSGPDGALIYVNQEHERIFGYEPGEMIGMHVSRLHPESAQPVLRQLLGSVMERGEWSGLLDAQSKDGSRMVTSNRVGSIRDEQGRPRYLFNILYDYTPELQRQEELRTARDKAESASAAKSNFLSSMSHELRTPMNAILGFSQLLELDGNLTEDQQDSVKEIMKAGNHLLELINEVLDLARIESGKIDLSLEPLDAGMVIEECCSLLRPLADKRGIMLNCGGWDSLRVRADRVRLKQVLVNLLSNAIKYNTEQGSVRVHRQETASGTVRIAVSDTGPGIPEARLGELFQPFSRLDADKTTTEGTGIGLTITRRLVEMMGGSIGVASAEGKGSTFWIDLPEAAEEAAEITGEAGDEAPASSAHHAQSVLYVDDNPANLKLVSQIFGRRPQVRLLTAHEAGLGIELALAHRPDLILLDINMPGMDGYQVLAVLKADTGLRDIPVIAVTANAMPRDVARGLQAGFADYLTKPLNVELLLSAVDKVLLESSHRQPG